MVITVKKGGGCNRGFRMWSVFEFRQLSNSGVQIFFIHRVEKESLYLHPQPESFLCFKIVFCRVGDYVDVWMKSSRYINIPVQCVERFRNGFCGTGCCSHDSHASSVTWESGAISMCHCSRPLSSHKMLLQDYFKAKDKRGTFATPFFLFFSSFHPCLCFVLFLFLFRKCVKTKIRYCLPFTTERSKFQSFYFSRLSNGEMESVLDFE